MSLMEGQPKAPVRAWSIEFADSALPDRTALTVVSQPRAAWVYANEIDATAALADVSSPTADADGFTFVFIQSGSATVYQLQKQTEQWMARRAGEQEGILEVLFRSERLLWRHGRAICFGTPDFLNDILVAIAHFSLCETELREFERRAEKAWRTIEDEPHLTDKLSWRSLRLRPHVDELTRNATAMQAGYLKIERALEAPAPEFSGAARRVFIELTLLASVENRLMRLDDAVDGMADHYKFVSERFAEYHQFLREHRIVVLIVIVLTIQTLVLAESYWRPTFDQFVQHWLPPAPSTPAIPNTTPPPTKSP